ncbi:hypothetical protein [Bacillus inaquosorum]|uniref:hypothetical protein n=1 Tax=Bacillus inaquosorum TaxID=483913 RepID=UPI00227E7063|nr:hypothetical protein [Bacillus inaquosorum]MCY9034708.1 hypothetical protein [Bacillus inaquosorum]
MVFLNHLDLVIYSIIVASIFWPFLKILLSVKSFSNSVFLFLSIPFVLFPIPIQRYRKMVKHKTEILKAVNKSNLTLEKKKKIKKIVSSNLRLIAFIFLTDIFRFSSLLNIYIETGKEYCEQRKHMNKKDISKAVYEDTKNFYKESAFA